MLEATIWVFGMLGIMGAGCLALLVVTSAFAQLKEPFIIGCKLYYRAIKESLFGKTN